MEWTTTSKAGETHHITVTPRVPLLATGDYLEISVTRLRLNGGAPRTLFRNLPPEVTMDKGLSTVNMLVNLDDEMFDMIIGMMNDATE